MAMHISESSVNTDNSCTSKDCMIVLLLNRIKGRLVGRHNKGL